MTTSPATAPFGGQRLLLVTLGGHRRFPEDALRAAAVRLREELGP